MKNIGWIVCMCLFGCMYKLQAQDYDLSFMPAMKSGIKISFPLSAKFSGEIDVLNARQDNRAGANFFKYDKYLMGNFWLTYAGVKNVKLSVIYSNKEKFEVPEVASSRKNESRFTLLGAFTQPFKQLSVFEQLRIETRFFEDGKGVSRSFPRVRLRLGSARQFNAGSLLHSQAITYYSEVSIKFPPKDFAANHFDFFTQTCYYTAGISKSIAIDAGAFGQLQLKPNGKKFYMNYGPQLYLKYSIAKTNQKRL